MFAKQHFKRINVPQMDSSMALYNAMPLWISNRLKPSEYFDKNFILSINQQNENKEDEKKNKLNK